MDIKTKENRKLRTEANIRFGRPFFIFFLLLSKIVTRTLGREIIFQVADVWNLHEQGSEMCTS